MPAGYRKTALVEANPGVMAAIPDVSESARSFVETVTDAGTVFGLIGNNHESTVAKDRDRRIPRHFEQVFRVVCITLTSAITAYRPVSNIGQVHMGVDGPLRNDPQQPRPISGGLPGV